MTLSIGTDFTPIENYETTLEQKWDALSHARSRIPADDVLEVAAMFGLVHIVNLEKPDVPTCRWKHPLTEDNKRLRKNGHTYCIQCSRERRRRANKETRTA